MNFWDRYTIYREKDCFIKNFLLNNDIIEHNGFIETVSLDTNHTYDGRESRAVATAIINYQQEIYKIVDIEFGINTDAVIHGNDDITDYTQFIEYKKKHGEITILDNEINECKVILENMEFDNYKKEISFVFDFQGDMHDASIIDYNSFQIALGILSLNENAPYWGKLLIQALHIMEKKQFDLAFLLIFTAFENFISLLAEKHENNFYKEINIKKMELKNKMKILLKYILDIQPSKGNEQHPSIGIIETLFSQLYEFRNKVAHGNYREVDEKNCQDCMNLFFIFHTTIVKKPKDNNELLKFIKSYTC